MTYEYTCKNTKCPETELIKSTNIPISEYSEDKLPKCPQCGEATKRIYTSFGLKTFGDGYKS